MKITCYTWLAVVALLAAPVLTVAAPPKPTGVFPLGVQRGQSVTLTVSGAMKPWPAQVQTSGAGITLTPEKEEGRFKLSATADAEPGLRLVRFFNDEGASTPQAIVVGTLPEIEEKEPNNETTAAQSISPVAVVVNGRLAKAGDIDTFSVALTAGQTLVADVAAERLGSPMDGVLQVLSADGFVLAQNHDTRGQDPRLVFTAPRDGAYLVRLFAFPATATGSVAFAGGDKFAYRMTLTTGGFLNYTMPLAVERGVETSLELVGWNIPEALRTKKVTPPTDATSVVIHDAQLAGEVRLDVVDKKCLAEAEPNDRDHAQAIAWPVVVSGRIVAPGDVDVFAIEAKKGQNLALVVRSQRLGFPLDGELRVYDSQKKLLTSRDDSAKERDPELNYTILADGKYLIAVADLYGAGSADHAYTLDIALVEPDYTLAFAASELTTAAKKEIELPITIDRANSFAEEIEITVTGLPEGAKCEPVRSAAKGDGKKGDTAKKVTLKIAPGEQPFRGPIQITARSLGTAARQRTAKMPLAGLGTSVDNVWLTVTSK
ncbi:MAG: PPC domain-containing protein [Planctomycetes bacterium]|nr:PPC domain-containing protein [Planctomycetota bacterium]